MKVIDTGTTLVISLENEEIVDTILSIYDDDDERTAITITVTQDYALELCRKLRGVLAERLWEDDVWRQP